MIRAGYYYCYSCKQQFESPRRVRESRGEFWGMPAFEECCYCPICGDEDFEYVDSNREEDEEE